MRNLLTYKTLSPDFAALLLRLIFGGLFIRYGYIKLANYDQILPLFQDLIGIGSELSLILVIFAEFGCGILIAAGVFTRLAVIPVFITMWVAFFIAHAGDPFDDKALSFVFLLLSIVVFILGSGRFAVDKLLLQSK